MRSILQGSDLFTYEKRSVETLENNMRSSEAIWNPYKANLCFGVKSRKSEVPEHPSELWINFKGFDIDLNCVVIESWRLKTYKTRL